MCIYRNSTIASVKYIDIIETDHNSHTICISCKFATIILEHVKTLSKYNREYDVIEFSYDKIVAKIYNIELLDNIISSFNTSVAYRLA